MIYDGCLDLKPDLTSRQATNLATHPSSLTPYRPSSLIQCSPDCPIRSISVGPVQSSPIQSTGPVQSCPTKQSRPSPILSFPFFLNSNLVYPVQSGLSSLIHWSPGQSSPIQSSHPVLTIKPSPVKPVSPDMPSPGAFQSFLARPTPLWSTPVRSQLQVLSEVQSWVQFSSVQMKKIPFQPHPAPLSFDQPYLALLSPHHLQCCPMQSVQPSQGQSSPFNSA
jgi:hypothetical protein